ncbi:MAG: hypothetical protein ACREQ2_22405 [Candidatus Binatia bacterium]
MPSDVSCSAGVDAFIIDFGTEPLVAAAIANGSVAGFTGFVRLDLDDSFDGESVSREALVPDVDFSAVNSLASNINFS